MGRIRCSFVVRISARFFEYGTRSGSSSGTAFCADAVAVSKRIGRYLRVGMGMAELLKCFLKQRSQESNAQSMVSVPSTPPRIETAHSPD
jgi:hypothetical protein